MKKMSRLALLLLAAALLLTACAAPEAATTAPEASTAQAEGFDYHYNLGLKYLSEGNYQEAVLAFTAAIDIDAKRADAFVGRGDAYIGLDDAGSARPDYERAIALDDALIEAYLGVIEACIRQNDFDTALEWAKVALDKTGDSRFEEKIAELDSGNISDSANRVRKRSIYTPEGELRSYTIYEYDSLGRRHAWTHYDPEHTLASSATVEFDALNRAARQNHFDAEGKLQSYATFVYPGNSSLKSEQYNYSAEGDTLNHYFFFEYNENGSLSRHVRYDAEGTLGMTWICEYGEDGTFIRELAYNADGELETISYDE